MIAVPAWAILHNLHLIVAALRVRLTDVAIAPDAGVAIEIVGENSGGPLFGDGGSTAHIAEVFAMMFGQMPRTGGMGVAGEMFHT